LDFVCPQLLILRAVGHIFQAKPSCPFYSYNIYCTVHIFLLQSLPRAPVSVEDIDSNIADVEDKEQLKPTKRPVSLQEILF